MTASVTSYGDNQQLPGAYDYCYVPDQLIAGNLKIVTRPATITGAAAYARGTVMGMVTATGSFKPSVATATDGSQNPSAVLVDNVDATAGDVTGGLYLQAELNGNALIIDASLTLAAVSAAFRNIGLFVKTAVSAADPT